MKYVTRYRGGLGALSVSDEGPLRDAVRRIEELALQVGRDLGDAHAQGYISDAELADIDGQLQAERDIVGGYDAQISSLSAQDIPDMQARLDESLANVEAIGRTVRGERASGVSTLVHKAGFWVGAGALAAVGVTAWLLLRKKRRR